MKEQRWGDYRNVQGRDAFGWIHCICSVTITLFIGSYLAEVMSVECQCCLWSQLEEMELCSENLLSSGNRGQIEPELHLFTAHCNGNYIIRDQNKRHYTPLSTEASSKRMHAQKSALTFVKETAHSIPLQKIRVLGHTVHISNRVVQIKHVLRWLLVSMDSRGVLHPKNFQKSLDSSCADFLRLVLGGEVIFQVVE